MREGGGRRKREGEGERGRERERVSHRGSGRERERGGGRRLVVYGWTDRHTAGTFPEVGMGLEWPSGMLSSTQGDSTPEWTD